MKATNLVWQDEFEARKKKKKKKFSKSTLPLMTIFLKSELEAMDGEIMNPNTIEKKILDCKMDI